MINENIAHNVKWIEAKYKIKVSSFMRDILEILSRTFGGLHHTDCLSQWKGQNFLEMRGISYYHFNHISTFDYSDLTTLVLMGLKKKIRISVGVGDSTNRNRKLEISFSNARRWKDSKHPTLKQTIKRFEGVK